MRRVAVVWFALATCLLFLLSACSLFDNDDDTSSRTDLSGTWVLNYRVYSWGEVAGSYEQTIEMDAGLDGRCYQWVFEGSTDSFKAFPFRWNSENDTLDMHFGSDSTWSFVILNLSHDLLRLEQFGNTSGYNFTWDYVRWDGVKSEELLGAWAGLYLGWGLPEEEDSSYAAFPANISLVIEEDRVLPITGYFMGSPVDWLVQDQLLLSFHPDLHYGSVSAFSLRNEVLTLQSPAYLPGNPDSSRAGVTQLVRWTDQRNSQYAGAWRLAEKEEFPGGDPFHESEPPDSLNLTASGGLTCYHPYKGVSTGAWSTTGAYLIFDRPLDEMPDSPHSYVAYETEMDSDTLVYWYYPMFEFVAYRSWARYVK